MTHMPNIKIDPQKCIGCNTCAIIDPDTFELDTQTYKAKIKNQPGEIPEKVKTAVESCPVSAISIDNQP